MRFATNVMSGSKAPESLQFHVARSLAIGVDGGYNWMANVPQPAGLRKNYSGFGAGLGLGWLFGRGTTTRP